MCTRKQRNSSSNQPKSSCEEETINDAPPTSLLCEIYNKMDCLVSFLCRFVIFGPVGFKIVLAFIIIFAGSILNTLELKPSSYFASKKNILNVYFAKFGWGWTIGLLTPFVCLVLIRTQNYYQILTRHLVRLLIATIIWYIVTKLFVYIEVYTGTCKHDQTVGLSKRACLKGGYQWETGHDFSGHVFLLLYSILIINQEIKLYGKNTKDAAQSITVKNEENNGPSNLYNQNRKLVHVTIRIFYILLAILTTLWEFMLLSTSLYFHETFHKLFAGIIAVGFWIITYRVWYTSNSSSILRPLIPNDY